MTFLILKLKDEIVQAALFNRELFKIYFKDQVTFLKNMSIGDIIKINPKDDKDDIDDTFDTFDASYQYFLYNSSDEFYDELKLYITNYSLNELQRLSINFKEVDNEVESDNEVEVEPIKEPCISILEIEYKINDYFECLSDLI